MFLLVIVIVIRHRHRESQSEFSLEAKGYRKVQLDHEKLEVCQISLEFVSYVVGMARSLKGDHRHARDQLLRCSQSIPLNIAQDNGKRCFNDRNRFFEIARGSAMESGVTLDILVASGGCSKDQIDRGKALLVRIVSMLHKMTKTRESFARETENQYGSGEYDDE